MENKKYDFGEKTIEKIKNENKQWIELQVWQSPKFIESRSKAIELIEKEKYGLDVSDFWILKNKAGSAMGYTGLIISHNGCLKINDNLEDKLKFKPECVSLHKENGAEIVLKYCCPEQGLFEFGEISPKNCRNDYPYAMVLKRLMDRVILKNSKIAFYGIYSEDESEDFKKKQGPDESETKAEKSDKDKLKAVADKDQIDVISNWIKQQLDNCQTLDDVEQLKLDKHFKQSLSKLNKISSAKLEEARAYSTKITAKLAKEQKDNIDYSKVNSGSTRLSEEETELTEDLMHDNNWK